MINQEIEQAQRSVRTDAYQMSVGEIVNLYEENELLIDPEFNGSSVGKSARNLS